MLAQKYSEVYTKMHTVIFNPDEKDVLLHALFEDNNKLQQLLKTIIAKFEGADLDKLIRARDEKLSLLELILLDKEIFLPQLSGFYENCYGLENNSPEKKRLKAGIFYTLCKIMLVRCNYRKGLNKLMYAASFPQLPPKFTPLYLFRLGSIYIEQGKIQEAADVLTLSEHRCKEYKEDPIMRRLDLLISYQLLRVNVIRGNLIEAKLVHDNTKRKLNGEENVIFDSLRGYYHRWAGEVSEGYAILNKAYLKYRDNEQVKRTYARSWFNIMYQLSCCFLQMKKEENYQAKAQDMIMRAYAVTREFNYRNLGYCENMLGMIAMDKGELKKALEHFRKAYALFEKYTDYRNMARTKRNLGSVYARLKNYYEALKNLNQSLDYDNHTQLEIGIIMTLLQKTDLQIELVQYDKAREYLARIHAIKLPFKHPLIDEIAKRENFLANIDLAEGLIGESESIRGIRNEIKSHAKISEPLLITGESGTGKSFIAEDIHKKSKRKGQFKVVNCRLIPPAELDHEIFGNLSENKRLPGALERADQGTLFLEEICALPLNLQAKLSRFLDEKKIPPLNGGKEKELDVRIIFACKSSNLETQVANGIIGRDFYDRISAFILKVPPLRERRDDIRKLAEYFYVSQCKALKKKICGIKSCAMTLLEYYPWPGNVGELKKTINRCVVRLDSDRVIDREDVIMSLDSWVINPPVIIGRKQTGTAAEDTADKEIITRLQSLEEKLQQEEETPPRTRISDSYSIINAVFKIIQEHGPVRKSEIVAGCPDAEKSFHHWISILREKHGVVKVEDSGNFKVYSVVAKDVLYEKLKAGELVKTGEVLEVVEL
jgi:DNA-binding NtrC family response regulator